MSTDDQIYAAENLAAVLNDGMLVGDLAPSLTCREADTFAAFIAAFDSQENADLFLVAHAAEDDEGDEHFGFQPQTSH